MSNCYEPLSELFEQSIRKVSIKFSEEMEECIHKHTRLGNDPDEIIDALFRSLGNSTMFVFLSIIQCLRTKKEDRLIVAEGLLDGYCSSLKHHLLEFIGNNQNNI